MVLARYRSFEWMMYVNIGLCRIVSRASATVGTRSFQATSWCKVHQLRCHLEKEICPQLTRMANNGKWLHKGSCLFVVCLVDRRLSLYLDDPPAPAARAFSVSSRTVSCCRVLVSINVQLKYNNIVTCTLPPSSATTTTRPPFNLCSSSPPSAPHHSLLVSVY